MCKEANEILTEKGFNSNLLIERFTDTLVR